MVAAPYYVQAASPAPGRIPLEIEGDMHFGGEKFMVRAIIENLKEDPNDPYALPADAIRVKATILRPLAHLLLAAPIIPFEIQILDEYGNFLSVDEQPGSPFTRFTPEEDITLCLILPEKRP